MKKFTKFAAILLPALVLAMALPGIACAQTVKPKTIYINTAPATNYSPGGYYIDGASTCTVDTALKKSQFKKVKSSNPEVASVSVEKNEDGYSLEVQCKKAGKATITWKKGDVTYKQKIVVDDFTNPFEKITINGKDVTKKFNNSNVIKLKYNKWKDKEITIKGKVKKGWENMSAADSTSGVSYDGSTRTFTYKTKVPSNYAAGSPFCRTQMLMIKYAGNQGKYYSEYFFLRYV